MSSCTPVLAVVANPPPSILDDEITAWALQLEEVGIYGLDGKGKFPAGNPTDSVIAFDTFQSEIETHVAFLRDVKLANSMALAVNTDADVITELTAPEEQAQNDHEFALQLSRFDDDDQADMAGPSSSQLTFVPRWLSATAASARVIENVDPTSSVAIEAPHNCIDQQANALQRLS